MRGILSKMFDWLGHPLNDESTAATWAMGLVLILIVAFLWSTVINRME